jgi:glycosyltransferase involved in cell wall biosynthesis
MTLPTIYVMGAYVRAGGARMAYEIGLAAHQALGLPFKAVLNSGEDPRSSSFEYPIRFETVERGQLSSMVRPDDLLICNPSFSDGSIGLTHRCRKLMYIQGFNTFSNLDLWFDHYASVSRFVQDYIRNTYDLKTDVISPFVSVDTALTTPWRDRPGGSIWFYMKGHGLQLQLLERLKDEVGRVNGCLARQIDWEGSLLWAGSHKQNDLLEKIAARQYFVSLSVSEGFGLVPLEAMGLGTAVVGFDGFGGRDYFRRGENCLVRRYPDVAGVAQDLVRCLEEQDLAERLASQGPMTASFYSRDRFREKWIGVLEGIFKG